MQKSHIFASAFVLPSCHHLGLRRGRRKRFPLAAAPLFCCLPALRAVLRPMQKPLIPSMVLFAPRKASFNFVARWCEPYAAKRSSSHIMRFIAQALRWAVVVVMCLVTCTCYACPAPLAVLPGCGNFPIFVLVTKIWELGVDLIDPTKPASWSTTITGFHLLWVFCSFFVPFGYLFKVR